jgi:hypothetical protein
LLLSGVHAEPNRGHSLPLPEAATLATPPVVDRVKSVLPESTQLAIQYRSSPSNTNGGKMWLHVASLHTSTVSPPFVGILASRGGRSSRLLWHQ